MKSKRIKKVLASLLMASMIASSTSNVFAVTPTKYMSNTSVHNMLRNLTQEQREALNQLELTPQFRISPDINLKSSEEIKVIVQFKQNPAKVEMVKNQINGTSISLQSAESKVEQSHVQFRKDIETIFTQVDVQSENSTNIEIHREFKHAFNGVSMTIPANAVEKLLESDMVKTIWKDREYKVDLPELTSVEKNEVSIDPLMADSVPHIGVDKLHAEGIKGEGIKVGVIDTGIDYNHPDLTNVYKGARLEDKDKDSSEVMGWDSVENDADPMETTYEDYKNSMYYPWAPHTDYATSHGTHVSGTIAGQGENTVNHSVTGVAPDVDLYAYRVLGPGGRGYTEWIIDGIDKSVEDGMDVINLSLGSSTNDPLYPTSIAINNAVLSGVVACVAAANAGPSLYTLGSPGTSPFAITVGASDVTKNTYGFKALIGGDEFDLTLFYKAPSFDYESNLEGITLPLEYVGLGSVEEIGEKNLAGKVAFIQRGELMFTEKISNAKNAGAEAIIIFNNVEGEMPLNGYDLEGIPTLSMTKEQGESILDKINSGENVELTFDDVYVEISEGDNLADFSSRGPVRGNYDIKPDLVAPGVDIFSTIPEFINDPEGDIDYDIAYQGMPGTSMATPHVAGIAALMLQQHPEYTPFDVKAVLMNTSEDLNGINSVFEEGAGRVNALEAVMSDVLIQVQDKTNTIDENGNIKEIEDITGSIAFGRRYERDSSLVDSRVVKIINNSSENKEFTLTVEFNPTEAGAQDAERNGVVLDVPSVINAAANESVEFISEITVPAGVDIGNYEGYIRLVNTANQEEEYQIPFAIGMYEKGFEFNVDRHAFCDDTYYNNSLLVPSINGVLNLNSPMKYMDVLLKDGVTGEALGYIVGMSGSLDGAPLDYEFFIQQIWIGKYFPLTGDSENPISDVVKIADEGHYKLAMITIDEDGKVYEVEQDVIVDNTPPEVTFDKEPGLYEISQEDLTTVIDPSTGDEIEAFVVKGNIFDSTVEYLNNIGITEGIVGPINQADNMIEYYQNSPMPSGYLNIADNGDFEFGVTLEELEEGPMKFRMVAADYGTAGVHTTPYEYRLVKEGHEYLGITLDKESITNDEEYTITLTLNNVENFVGGEIEVPYMSFVYDYVKAEINPELQSIIDEAGLNITFDVEEIPFYSLKFKSIIEEISEGTLEGLNGDIPFIDVTFKYKGMWHERLQRHDIQYFYETLGGYYKLGEEALVSVPTMQGRPLEIREKFAYVEGGIKLEGLDSIYGFFDRNKDANAFGTKVYVQSSDGTKYPGVIDERGKFEINVPIGGNDGAVLIQEAPGHMPVEIPLNLFVEFDGKLWPAYRTSYHEKSLAGDVNGDNVIDMEDAVEIYSNYGKYEGTSKYDVNFDGIVDDIDMSYVYKNFLTINKFEDVKTIPKDEFEGEKIEDVLKYLQNKGIFIGGFSAGEGFTPGQSVNLTARVHNFGEEERNVTLLLAIYDENNQLIDFVEASEVLLPRNLEQSNRGMININANIVTTEDTVKVKCFVWDSLDSLEPLVEVFELPILNN